MKLRNGFVSNSSSSSFMCQITKETFDIWDDSDLTDTELASCKNGHIFKRSFIVEVKPPTLSREFLLKSLDDLTDSKSESNKLRLLSDEELLKKWTKHVHTEKSILSPEECPICTLRVLPEELLLRFLLKTTNKSRNQILEDIRSEFSNYADFENWLNS